MTDPDLAKQLAEELDAVRDMMGPMLQHLQLLSREVTRLRGVVAAFGPVAASAIPDADDPEVLALAESSAILTRMAGAQDAADESALSTSSL